ncbi:MAG TPA: DMT family transporter [Capillibacterium sp.]
MARAYLAAVLTSFIFGLSFLFTKDALAYVTTHQLLAFRFLTAALLMTLLRVCGLIKIDFRHRPVGRIILPALFEPVLYFIFETVGIKLTTSSEAGLIIALIPVFVTILAILILKEHPRLLQVAAILISVAGVGFIVLGSGEFTVSGHTLGLLALLGAVLSAAFFNIFSRRLSREFRPIEITYVMMVVGALIFSGLALFDTLREPDPLAVFSLLRIKEVWSAVLYLGICSSVVAFFGMNYYIAKLGAARSAVFANLTTIVSVAAGFCFRGEPLYWYHLVGGVLILLGVWGTNRLANSNPHPEATSPR